MRRPAGMGDLPRVRAGPGGRSAAIVGGRPRPWPEPGPLEAIAGNRVTKVTQLGRFLFTPRGKPLMTNWTPASATVRGSVALLLVLALVEPEPRADATDDAVAKITQMNKDAIAALQAQKFEDARKLLKQGLDLADASGLQQHPITARTHIHMGVVLISGFKQRDLGHQAVQEGAGDRSDDQPHQVAGDARADRGVQRGQGGRRRAGHAAAGHAAPGPAPVEPASRPRRRRRPPPRRRPRRAPEGTEEPPSGIIHEPITEAKKGSTISVTVGRPGRPQVRQDGPRLPAGRRGGVQRARDEGSGRRALRRRDSQHRHGRRHASTTTSRPTTPRGTRWRPRGRWTTP